MMTMAGIDVAKKSLVIAVLDKAGGVVQTDSIDNTMVTIATWLGKAVKEYPRLALALESTCYYHETVVRVALAAEVPIRLLNPILTKQYIRSTVRAKKTDRSDAELIARLGLQGAGYPAAIPSDAKVLLRLSRNVRGLAQQLGLMDRALLERLPETDQSILTSLAESRTSLSRSASLLERTAQSNLPAATVELLLSIPGIGQQLASIFIAEIGDVKRFATSQQLVAYAGLDPRVRQSGTSLHRNTKLTKRGSPHLRRAAFLAAATARQHDSELKAYYDRKRAEGRTYTEAMMPLARKVLNRVYAVWKRQTSYEKS